MTEIELQADEWFNITGRGWVAAFKNHDQLPDKMTSGQLLHRYIKIDGKEYYITGVENVMTYTVSRSSPFGLLVRGEK